MAIKGTAQGVKMVRLTANTERTSERVASIAAQVLRPDYQPDLFKHFTDLAQTAATSDLGYKGLGLLADAKLLAGSLLTQR